MAGTTRSSGAVGLGGSHPCLLDRPDSPCLGRRSSQDSKSRRTAGVRDSHRPRALRRHKRRRRRRRRRSSRMRPITRPPRAPRRPYLRYRRPRRCRARRPRPRPRPAAVLRLCHRCLRSARTCRHRRSSLAPLRQVSNPTAPAQARVMRRGQRLCQWHRQHGKQAALSVSLATTTTMTAFCLGA